MTAVITNEDGLDTLLPCAEVEQVVAAVLEHEQVPGEVEVAITYVGDEEMRELNAVWRGIDASTDVLSFECDDEDIPGLPDDAPRELGDVILAPAVIAAQAAEFGSTPVEECRLMLVHGLMHLLGYDHLNEEDALEMESHELAVLRALARSRGDDPDAVRIGPTTRHADDAPRIS